MRRCAPRGVRGVLIGRSVVDERVRRGRLHLSVVSGGRNKTGIETNVKGNLDQRPLEIGGTGDTSRGRRARRSLCRVCIRPLGVITQRSQLAADGKVRAAEDRQAEPRAPSSETRLAGAALSSEPRLGGT